MASESAASSASVSPLGATVAQAARVTAYCEASLRLKAHCGRLPFVQLLPNRRLILWPDLEALAGGEPPTIDILRADLHAHLPGRTVLSVAEVGTALTLSERSVRRLVAERALATRLEAGIRLVEPDDLVDFVLTRRTPLRCPPPRATSWTAAKEVRS